MKLRIIASMCFLMTSLLSTAGCAEESLQEIFERKMKNDKMDGYNVIHIEETTQYGLIVNTAWTAQYPDNKKRPGINLYEKGGGKWVMRPGTGCDVARVSRLGIPGGKTLYCGAITKDRPFAKVMVGDQEAKIFSVTDGVRVWYAVADAKDIKVKGIRKNGSANIFR